VELAEQEDLPWNVLAAVAVMLPMAGPYLPAIALKAYRVFEAGLLGGMFRQIAFADIRMRVAGGYAPRLDSRGGRVCHGWLPMPITSPDLKYAVRLLMTGAMQRERSGGRLESECMQDAKGFQPHQEFEYARLAAKESSHQGENRDPQCA